MCDSGPTLSHKPLLGQLATCIPSLAIEACVLQLGNHAKILRLTRHKNIQQILNDSTTDLALA